ncbi:MAG: hypothetical protein WC997_16680 [Porticoccaceae bacterium]
MERQVYRLLTPQIRGFAAKAAVTVPDGWVARFSPPPRTLAQNAGTHVLYEIIAAALPEDDAVGWKAYCKLHHAVPILRAEDPEYREIYDNTIKLMSYEQKLLIMREFPATSRMDKSQINRYIAALQDDFARRGVVLELTEAA